MQSLQQKSKLSKLEHETCVNYPQKYLFSKCLLLSPQLFLLLVLLIIIIITSWRKHFYTIERHFYRRSDII